jgi:prolyl-tRNA synthetase
MKFSQTFIPTTKEAPKDATLPSHIYLVRAGFINQISAGIYNFLPLGKIVLDKIKNIVKEELDKANAHEVQLGFVTPSELWQKSGRFEKYGKELLRFKDRKNNDYVLGPTHEEMMVELVKNRVKSYKNLPLNLYQINTKFRDEARPRFGLMRGREFLMKDGYSFHASEDDMVREFNHMEETYKKIFARLGLDFRVVEADSGAIGGSGSKEFMVLADSGEDTIVVCQDCEYGANIEAAKRVAKKVSTEAPETDGLSKFHTPDTKSIEDVAEFFRVDAHYTIKAIIKKAIYDDSEELVAFFVRGNDNLQEIKAINAVNANDIVDATEEEIEKAGIVAGYVGPFELPIRCVIDNELKDEESMICGANEKDYHMIGFSLKDADESLFADLVEVQEGDTCICCGKSLSYTKGIEAGHIFQLGTRYTDPLDANFLDENGKQKPMVMGTYGIGVSRLVAAVVEQHHDEKGCKWTKETTPYDVDIIISNTKDEEQVKVATQIYDTLQADGINTLLDDRKDRFGPKMADFELIGFRYALIVGKNLKDGKLQIVDRATLSKTDIDVSQAVEAIKGLV